MTLSLRGIGDAATCGVDPCTWWDKVYMRDECLAYNACENPNEFWTIAAQRGLIVGGVIEIVHGAGGVVSAVGQDVGAAAGDTAGSTLNHLFKNPDGSMNWASVAVVAAGGLLAVAILKGR